MVYLSLTGETQVNAKNRHGQTSAMKAVLYDDLEALKLLHKAGRWQGRRRFRLSAVRTNPMTGHHQIVIPGVCALVWFNEHKAYEQISNKWDIKLGERETNKAIKSLDAVNRALGSPLSYSTCFASCLKL